ncbi:hypothetical protein COX84_02445 [Candidatus Micrarchaeota archaeon CG_4_10_14_0_2_um_filter_49_7]|nr:MAG: hypothetical protein COX84_02445 [Candidatus Micrarchaeota archaeon CG_4_10_14_0_2_um_filter_49_7]HII53999.1 NAD(P)-dependent oxidoreductase [Candidatus Micrarchaeota archaeon]
MKIIITGAGGNIGRHVVSRLLKDGQALTLLAREPQAHGPLSKACRIIQGDITRAECLPAIPGNADCLVHLAGSLNFADEKEMFCANVDGTKNVLEWAVKNGVGKFIYASSLSVYGRSKHDGMPITETSKCEPDSYYGFTKYLGENFVLAEKRLTPVSLRVGMAYGKGFEKGYFDLFRMMKRFGPFVIGDGKNRIPFVHASDVANAVSLATRKCSGVYNICAEPVEQRRAMMLAAKGLGLSGKGVRHLPYNTISRLLAAYNAFARLAGKKQIPREYIDMVAFDRNMRFDKAAKELGFAPKVKIEEGIREMADEYLGRSYKVKKFI